MGGMIYSRPITEAMFSTESKRASFRRVSKAWHQFLQMPSVLELQPTRGTQTIAASKEAIEEEYRRWKMMRFVSTEEELQCRRLYAARCRLAID